MKKEYMFTVVVGLFLLSYVLDLTVNPLNIPLKTPYSFLSPAIITKYPFTTASIIIKGLGIFLGVPLVLSLIEGHNTAKGASLLVIIALMQLYSLQDVATGARVVPLEWALSISLAGIALLLPMVIYFVRGGLDSMHKSLGGKTEEREEEEENE